MEIPSYMCGSFVVDDLLIARIILLIVCFPFHLEFFQWWCILGLLKDKFANKPSSITWLRNANSPSYIYTSHLSVMITVYLHQSHVPLVSMLVYLNAWKLSYLNHWKLFSIFFLNWYCARTISSEDVIIIPSNYHPILSVSINYLKSLCAKGWWIFFKRKECFLKIHLF